jgi:3-oxoacyl-(acyl-carrier-protein) synthase
MTIEFQRGGCPGLLHYGCNSDASDAVGIPKDGGRTPELFRALATPPTAVCTHATGTAVQAKADPAALFRIYPEKKPSLHLLKPFLGHTIGASGMIESVILARFLRDGMLPPNRAGLHTPAGFAMPDHPLAATGPVAKLSHGMGGHNALLVLDRLPE